MIAKITKADDTNIDSNTAAPINVTLHSMIREIVLEFNIRNIGETSQLYPYRSVLESLPHFCMEVQETRFLSEGWTQDNSRQINVTAVAGNNAGLNARVATFARSTLVELICRPHLDVLHQDALFLQISISTWSWFRYRSTLCASPQL